MAITIDMKGNRYGRLTAISFESKDKNGASIWLFRCDCGSECVRRANDVRTGKTQSCGCLRNEMVRKTLTVHGQSNNRIYQTYGSMKRRCYGNIPRYFKHYRDKGITVCDEWLDKPQAFIAWAMANGYSDNLTLDRIDNSKGYSPENCRFITQPEQTRNLTTSVKITINGETKVRAEWAKILGVSEARIRNCVNAGGGPEQILNLKNIARGNYK